MSKLFNVDCLFFYSLVSRGVSKGFSGPWDTDTLFDAVTGDSVVINKSIHRPIHFIFCCLKH